MNLQMQAVHFDMKDETREFIEKKLERLGFAEDLIVDMEVNLVKDTHEYELECLVHFRWGKKVAIKYKSYDLHEGIDTLTDKVALKVKKEKGKIKEH